MMGQLDAAWSLRNLVGDNVPPPQKLAVITLEHLPPGRTAELSVRAAIVSCRLAGPVDAAAWTSTDQCRTLALTVRTATELRGLWYSALAEGLPCHMTDESLAIGPAGAEAVSRIVVGLRKPL
jgi:hypothetical protein